MSSTIEMLTVEDAYQIAYLTKHGWEPDYNFSNWKKDGLVKISKSYYSNTETKSEWFNLGDAFYEQQNMVESVIDE